MSRRAYRMAAFCFTSKTSRLLELSPMLVRFDHIASLIVNVNHGIATESVSLCKRMKN